MILINEQGKSGISTGDDLPSKPFLEDENTNSPFSMADQFQTQEPKSTLAEIEPIESEQDEVTKSRILDQDNFNSLVKQKIRKPELVEGIDQFEEPDRPLFLASSIVKNYSEVNPLFIRNPNILSEEDRMDEINEVSINEFKRTVETPEEFISLWQDKYDKEDKFRANHESIFTKTREATIKSLASKSGGARWEEVAASIPKEELEENQLSYYSTFSKSRIAQEKALASSLPYLQEVFEMRQSDEIKGQKISLWDIVTFGGMDGEVIANDTESVVSKLETAYMSLDEEGRENLVSATQTLMQIMPEENRTDLLDRFGNAAGDFATEIIGGASKTVARGVMGVTGVASLEDFDKELVFQRDMTDAMKSSIETKRSDGGDIGQVEEWAGSIAGSVAHGLLFSNPVTATYGALSYMERARTDLFDLGRNSGLSDDDALMFAGKYQAGLGSLYILESGVTNKILFGKFPVMDKALSRISASVGNIYLRGVGRVVTNTAIETTSEVLSNIAPQVVQSVASAVEESGGSQLWAAQGGNDWLGEDGIISDALSKENLSQILSVTLPLSLFGAFGGFSDKKRSLAFAKKISLEQWESIGGNEKTFKKFNESANSSDPKEQAKTQKHLEEGFLNLEPKSERSEQVRKDLAEAMTKAAEEASVSKVFPKLVVSKETGKIEVISPETNEVVAVANSPEEATKLAYEFMGLEAEKKDAEYDVLLSLLEAGASLSKEAKDANATFEVDLSKEVNSTDAREQALEDSKSEVEAIVKAGYTRLKSLDESVARLKELDKLSGGDGNIPSQVIYGENVETETSITRKIYAGANIMDLVHEDGHAARANLIKSGDFNETRFNELLVKLNNALKGKKTRRTGETIEFFVGESPTAKESSEAFAELTEMEVLNTRKGKKTGIRDIVRRFFAAEARLGDVEARNFISYIRSMKEKYSRVFTRKTIIDKAVRDGKISKKEIDDLRAMLQGTKVEEEQAKETKKTVKKAKKKAIKELAVEIIGDTPIEDSVQEEIVEIISSITHEPLKEKKKTKSQLADDIYRDVYRNLDSFPILATIIEQGKIKILDPVVKMLKAKDRKNQGVSTSKVKQLIADKDIKGVYDGLIGITSIDNMGGTTEGRLAAKKVLRSIYTSHDDYSGRTPDQIMDDTDILWSGLAQEIQDIVEGNSRDFESQYNAYYQKLENEAVETSESDKPFEEVFDLEEQTDESIDEEEKRIEQMLGIKKGIDKKLKGDAGEYGTSDMFDTTAGDMALFSQPSKPVFTKKEVQEAVSEVIEEIGEGNPFSMGTPRDYRDDKYLELAKDHEGNRDELQKMVDEAAKKAGFNSPKLHHGGRDGFTSFDPSKRGENTQSNDAKSAFYFSSDKSHASMFASFLGEREGNGRVLSVFLKGDFLEVDHSKLDSDEMEFSEGISKAKSQGKDGVVFKGTWDGFGFGRFKKGRLTPENEEYNSNDSYDVYAVFDANRIKSADPVTYDENGNIIPLSQRFNEASDSINFSMGSRRTYHADIVKALFDKIKTKEESPYANFMWMKTMADKLGKHKRDTDEVFTAFGKKYTRKALDKEDGFEMSQEQQIRRSYDLFQAMLDSLPVEVRTYVNFNVAALSKKSTNNQRKEYLLEKMDKAEDAFNKYRIAEYRRNIKKTMRAAKPDSKIGRAKGKITPEVHALFDRVEKYMETFLSDDEIQIRLNKFDEEIEKIVSKGRTEENLKKIVEINEEKDLFFRFVNYSDKLINRANPDANARLASELEEAAMFLEEARLLGRNRHKTLMEIREAEINRAVMMARAANPEAQSEEILAASRKAGTTKEELKSFFYGLEDLENLFVKFFGEELASNYIPRFRDATVAVKSSLRKREKAYRDVIEQATGLKGTKLDYYIYDMRTNPTHTFTIKPIDTISESINIETFISSPDPAKAFGFSPEEVSEINGLIEEELNNPDSNRSEIEFERKIEKEAKEVKLTTSVLIERIMTWKQENYKFNLAKYGYGESFQEQAEKALDKVKGARESMEFMRQEYDASYDKGNEVYRQVNQINLPKWDNYAGTLINYGSNKELEVGGTFNLNGNPYDVTKKRINHEWEIIPTDAFELFIDKTTQMDHYAAYAEVFGEINAITGDVEVKKQMSLNPSLAKRLKEYLDDIQRDNSNSWSSPIIDRLLKNRSILYLSYNLPTIAKSTIGSYMNTYLGDVGLADSIRYQKKIFQNNGEIFKKMLYSDEIQNKFHSGSMPEVEFLFNKLKEEKPSQYRNFLMEGMRLIGSGDAYGSTINAAVHYAYHYDSYLEANKDKTEEAEKFAAYKALEQLGRTSQPLHKMDVGATKLRGGSLWNMLTAFTSEPIKKAIIYKNAWGIILKGVKTDKKSLLSNPKTQKAIRQIVAFHAIGLVMEVIGSAWKDSINDDDDEVFDSENWNIGSIALSTFFGNLRVLPIFGDILTQWPKDSGVLKEQKKAMMAMYNMMKIAFTAEELEDGEFWELVLDATRIHYSAGVPARIVEQSVGLIGNLAEIVIPE